MSEVLARSLAVMPPAQAWEMIGRAPQQYLLLGDCHHFNFAISQQVTLGIPTLARSGFRHLGIESSLDESQSAINRYFGASMQERITGEDIARLAHEYSTLRQLGVPEDIYNQTVRPLRLAQVYVCRQQNVRLHCLNTMPNPQAIFNDLAPDLKTRMKKYMEFYLEGKNLPEDCSVADKALFTQRAEKLMAENFDQDRERALYLRTLARHDRAALLFGAAHFSGRRYAGIDGWLPPERIIYMALGREGQVNDVMSGVYGSLAQPDLAFLTDRREVHVLPGAFKKALWPAPAI